MINLRLASICLALALSAGAAVAQGTEISLGASSFDASAPVEVSADSLSVNQTNGLAAFDGNVLVAQGEVRMSAGRVEIEYATDGSGNADGIARLTASGGVTFVTAAEAVEASQAVYEIATGTVTLSGDVILTQGATAISGDRLVVDLERGTASMEGRVRTVFTAGGGN